MVNYMKKIIYQNLINKEIVKGLNRATSLRKTRRMFEKWCLNEWQEKRNVYFVTFTFSDDYLPFNRKKFVDYLSKTCRVKSILYEDYGKENDRFHLHGFISVTKKLNIKEKDYFNKFGFVKLENANLKMVDYVIKYSTKFIIRYDYSVNGELKIHNFRTIKTNPKFRL